MKFTNYDPTMSYGLGEITWECSDTCSECGGELFISTAWNDGYIREQPTCREFSLIELGLPVDEPMRSMVIARRNEQERRYMLAQRRINTSRNPSDDNWDEFENTKSDLLNERQK